MLKVGSIQTFFDRIPRGVEFKDDGVDVVGNRVVSQRSSIFEIDDLGSFSQFVPGQSYGCSVEAHLEQGLVLEPGTGRFASLVVDYAQSTVRSHIDSVDYSSHRQPGGQSRIDELFAGRRLDEGRVFQAEIVADENSRTREPFLKMRSIREKSLIFRIRFHMCGPTGEEKALRSLLRSFGSGPVVEMLQNRMHKGAPKRREGGRLVNSINYPESEQQGALLEVFRPRRGQGRMSAHVTTVHRAYDTYCSLESGIMTGSTSSRRRGPFRAGERVQLTDPKGRQYTISLTQDGYFQSTRGSFRHRELIGRQEGTVVETEEGRRFLALRPLVGDYVLSMPRGATVIYPKDAAQIVHAADVFPGASVFEAGLGSGALTLSLLGATGPSGHVLSVERRPEFAEIAEGNVRSWYAEECPPWTIRVGEAVDVLEDLDEAELDHVILDMLAPWEVIEAAARALRPGGVILAYVATTTQLSRFVEELRESERYTEPSASETLIRTWHLEGLAVRPDHRMVAHTGFLALARRLAPGVEPLRPTRRPAKAAYSEAPAWEAEWAESAERPISERKLRKVRRDVAHRADVEETGRSEAGRHGYAIKKKIEAELNERAKARREAER